MQNTSKHYINFLAEVMDDRGVLKTISIMKKKEALNI